MSAPAPTPIEQLLTVTDVMKLLQVKRTWVYEAANRGLLPHVRLGSRLRFERSQLEEWIKRNRSSAPSATVLPIAGRR